MQRWTIHLDGGPRKVNHSAVSCEDFIYSFGGYCTGEDFHALKPIDTYKLNTVSLRWRSIPLPKDDTNYIHREVPFKRYGHTTVAFMRKVYLWGGRNDSQGACSNLFCFDTDTQRWEKCKVDGLRPGARDGHSACLVNTRMYIFGGFVEQPQRFSQDIHYLDIPTLTWTQVQALGKPAFYRDFHTASSIGDIMYVFGGRSDLGGAIHSNEDFYDNRMTAFDTRHNAWIELPVRNDPPDGRRSHNAFVYKGELYIFGGYNSNTETHYKDVHKFNPETCEWTAVKVKGAGPCRRRRAASAIIGTKVYIFGGTSPQQESDGTDYELYEQADLCVLDLVPTLKTLCCLAVIQYKLDLSELPKSLKWDINAMTIDNSITRPLFSATG